MKDVDADMRHALVRITAAASEYCGILEDASGMEKKEFVNSLLTVLPKIYLEVLDCQPGSVSLEEEPYFPNYVDEDYYEAVRRHAEDVLGPDDVFLETFEEDMKYSDTPIAASISECLADIFQPLYNFVGVVRDSDGADIVDAYIVCREAFDEYWSQTLCNVLRALNALRSKGESC